MSVNVRVFGYPGLAAIPINQTAGQDHKDSVYVLPEPYIWCQTALNVSATPVTLSYATATRTGPSPAPANDATTTLYVEVQDGGTIRFEVNPPSRSQAADVNSRAITGRNTIQFGSGWTLSVIDASTVAS